MSAYEPRQALRGLGSVLASILIVVGAVAAALATSRAADTSRVCELSGEVRKMLAKAGESPVFEGIASTGDLFELWTSPDGVTWTAAVTSPTGVMCIIGIGGGAKFSGVPS